MTSSGVKLALQLAQSGFIRGQKEGVIDGSTTLAAVTYEGEEQKEDFKRLRSYHGRQIESCGRFGQHRHGCIAIEQLVT